LRRQLAADPDNLFVWHHLARVLAGLGQGDEAEDVLEQAVAVARARSFADPLGVLVCADLISRRRERGAAMEPLLSEARVAYPSNCVLLYSEGHELIRRGAYVEAVDRFDRILAFDPGSAPPDGPAYEERLIGELSHDGRGTALFKAGRYSEAAEAYLSAERLAPTNPAYAVKRKLASARDRVAADAS
jgi:tetratricopeptide (TPR) repeat protein